MSLSNKKESKQKDDRLFSERVKDIEARFRIIDEKCKKVVVR